jgi:hypothetical protein
MKNRVLLTGGVLCAFLMVAAPARAVIRANLENPTSGPVSGIGLVSGWAFAEDGAQITVRPRIDGVTQADIIVPCCGPRQDVVNTLGPGTPLNTGFSGGQNRAELSAGPHTIGVEISAPGNVTVIIDRSVRVVKPGGTSFATSFDLSGAAAAIEGNSIVVSGVQVGSASGEVEDDVDIQYNLSSQSPAITDSLVSQAGTSFRANLTGDQEIPTPVTTEATGEATLTLNADNTLTYEVRARNFSSPLLSVPPGDPTSAAHIHMAPAGQNGGIIIFLTPPIPPGPDEFVWTGTTAALTPEQLEALRNARLYVNIHTQANMGGELRGQIVAAPGSGAP